MLSNHLILCCPLLLPPSMFPSIRVFSNESPLHTRWPKYWSFSFDISPSIDYPELISFSMDWLDPLTMQGILKSLLQHHSSKASILWCSVFFTVQLSYPYMTTGKTIDWLDGHFLTKQCLCFLICCLVWSSLSFPRSKCLLISWLQSSAMILAPPEIKFRLWTLWERVNMGWFESISLKHGYHHMWNRLPGQEVTWDTALRAGALGQPCRMGWGGRRGVRDRDTCTPMADSCECMEKTATILYSN